MTRKTALAFGIGASFLLAAGAASADCATEVQALQQQMGTIDSPNATIGPTDRGVQQPSPSASADTGTSSTTSPTDDQIATENSANATIGAIDPGVQQPDPGASPGASSDTSASSSTTTTTDSANADGSSVTTEDTTGANATIGATDPGVQQPQNEDMNVTADSGSSSSTTTQPSTTITETSRVGEMDTAAGGRAAALASLKKAQLYADQGQEDACMSELSTAKQHLGVE